MAAVLSEENFDAFLGENALVLADFYKDGCVACRRVAPLVSQTETAYAGRLAAARVNTTANAGLAQRLGIEATPTLILYKDGSETARHRGVITKDELTALIEAAL